MMDENLLRGLYFA